MSDASPLDTVGDDCGNEPSANFSGLACASQHEINAARRFLVWLREQNAAPESPLGLISVHGPSSGTIYGLNDTGVPVRFYPDNSCSSTTGTTTVDPNQATTFDPAAGSMMVLGTK